MEEIEDRFVRSVLREMSISENYEGEITPIRSNISRFSRGTVLRPDYIHVTNVTEPPVSY
jgi:hypothetical protein